MNGHYGLFTYNIYTDNEIDHYVDRYLYGSIDGRYPETNLLRELDEEERNVHARKSIEENPLQIPIDVRKVLFYSKELNDEDLEGYDMVLLAKIGEPVYVG